MARPSSVARQCLPMSSAVSPLNQPHDRTGPRNRETDTYKEQGDKILKMMSPIFRNLTLSISKLQK